MSKRSGSGNSEDYIHRAVKAKDDATITVTVGDTTEEEEEHDYVLAHNNIFFQVDMVTKILSYLDLVYIARCARVSKTLLKAISLLENLNITPSIRSYDGWEVEQKLKFAALRFSPENSLTSIYMHLNYARWNPRNIDYMTRILKSCKKLRHLTLAGISFVNKTFHSVSEFTELETLVLDCFDFEDFIHSTFILFTMLKNKTNLRVLELSSETSTRSSEDEALSDFEEKCEKLLSEVIGGLVSLQRLTIKSSEILEGLDFRIMFQRLINLEYLLLGNYLVCDEELEVISEHCLKLRDLRMHYTYGFSLAALINVLLKCPIQKLSIRYDHKIDSGLAAVREICQSCRILTHLYIYYDYKEYHEMMPVKEKEVPLYESAACEASAGRTSIFFNTDYLPKLPFYWNLQ